MHTYMHAYKQTYIQACIFTYVQTRLHAFIHTYIHAYIPTNILSPYKCPPRQICCSRTCYWHGTYHRQGQYHSERSHTSLLATLYSGDVAHAESAPPTQPGGRHPTTCIRRTRAQHHTRTRTTNIPSKLTLKASDHCSIQESRVTAHQRHQMPPAHRTLL